MANGETLKEIKSLLSEQGAIKTSVAMRLMLDLMSQLYEKIDEYHEEQLLQSTRLDLIEKNMTDRVEKVERASIVLWVQNHPKIAIAIMTAYLVVSATLDVRQVLAATLGVKLP